MVEQSRTLYQILGVTRFASTQQIRESYLRLVRTLHPDRLVDRPEAERRLAERRMREVTHAWSILGDEAARADYDRSLSAPPPPRRPSAEVDDRVVGGDGGEDTIEDDVELSAHEAFLLRRGPILIALVIAAVIFIGSAYAGSSRPSRTPPTTAPRCIGVQPVNPAAPANSCP
jgi:curved DNA-binding protein CbpA